jgi:outer membrane protein OmpA-like peptidoglycan-associated protein
MRFLLIIITLILLPVLVLLHRFHFNQTMQGSLVSQVRQALSDPAFDDVRQKTRLNYLDVVLLGSVADVASREEARRLVLKSVWGVRCREEDNHIQIPAKLEGKIQGEHLTLYGCLHDAGILRDLTATLKETRPSLDIQASEVLISPYVTITGDSLKKADNIPAFFQPIWALIRVPAKLKITKTGDAIRVSGMLPAGPLREDVIKAVLGTRVETTLDSKELLGGPYVTHAPFTKAETLAAFLTALIESQENTVFEADDHGLSFSANVTEAQYETWKPLVARLGDELSLKPNLKFFPSIYHLPGYKAVSKVAPELLKPLENSFQQWSVQFERNSFAVAPPEMPKLDSAGKAIIGAGPELKIVLAAHPDTGVDLKTAQALAKRRAEAVVAQFVDRGLSAHVFEIVVVEPARLPAGVTASGFVEMIVK